MENNLIIQPLGQSTEEYVKDLIKDNPKEAFDFFAGALSTLSDCYKCKEIEKTKRQQIEAQKEIALERIGKTREFLMTYLDMSFDERRENFNKIFQVIDKALETGNVDQLSSGLTSMVRLSEQSPFAALSSFSQAQKMIMSKEDIEL